MELKHVMAIKYNPAPLHDIGYECHLQYTCPECRKLVTCLETDLQFDGTIFYKTTARCNFCGTECIVHNPTPEE